MPARSYSDIIRHERERSGVDLAEMSRRLHIRPDILDSIEKGDFDRMPARGYSKNMVRAYARALGLDEKQICDMYLKEVQGHELGGTSRYGSSRSRSAFDRPTSQGRSSRTRSASPSRDARADSRRMDSSYGFDSPYQGSRSSRFGDDLRSRDVGSQRGGSGSGSRGRASDAYRSGYGTSARSGRSAGSGDRSRPRRGDGARSQRSQQPRSSSRGSGRSSESRQRQPLDAAGAAIGSIPSLFGGRSRQDGRAPRSLSTIGSTPPYAQQPRQSSGLSLEGVNLPLVLAIVAALIIVLIVAVVVSNGAKQSSEDVPAIPISGLTDTSSPEDEQVSVQMPSVPTYVTFEYTVKDDQQAWVEVYLDGSSEATIATKEMGPKTESFDVEGTLKFCTANPDGVTCTVDGEEVDLEKSSTDEYVCTVSFAEYLKQWKADNGYEDSSSSSSSSSSSTSSSSSRSSTSSGSSSSASSSASSTSSE